MSAEVVRLPRLLVLTDRRAAARPLAQVVAGAVDGGARAVVLREKDLPSDDRRRLADELAAVLAPVDGLLVLAGGGLAGPAVHLAADEPVPEPRPALLGRSCHDAGEVARARDDRCDWITVSPWQQTPSKPGYGPPLGVQAFARLVGLPGSPPAFALGGVTPDEVAACLSTGVHGVAVMGQVMRSCRPDRVVADLLSRLPPQAAP